MPIHHQVFLDPVGAWPDWLHVVILAGTGVEYRQQCGGTACWQRSAEGYLVPLDPRGALDCLRQLFEGQLRGAGLWGSDEAERDRVANDVERCLLDVTYWQVTEETDAPTRMTLDRSRLEELDEAWVPVQTVDGAGVLVWENSD